MPAGEKKTVVLVDDDTEFLEELTRALGDRYEVHASLGDPGTLEVLRGHHPAAVVLDLDLATFDALELLELIHNDPALHDVPVLALSSEEDEAVAERARRLGAADLLVKPFAAEEVARRLERLVDGRARRAPGRLRLGALLVSAGLITQEQLDAVLERQRKEGGRLGEILVREGLVSEEDIVTAVARQMRLEVVDPTEVSPEPAAVSLLPRDFIVRHRLMPLRLREDGSLVVAMPNPLDVLALDEVALRTRRRVVPAICTESAFDEAVDIYYSSRGKLRDAHEEGEEAVASPGEVDAGIIELVDAVITDAAAMNASDIHLEPREEALVVRCRVDGVLHELREFPKDLQAGIISRLKIMGNMNIAERRLPQDGRATFELASGEVVDLRLASIPSLYGENITVRILEVAPLPPTLDELGLSGSNLERFEQALRVPEGGILIVGPTGSGKSTTLYTTLELIKDPARKIYTVEDPVERKIEGIIQTEVKPAIGLTFAQALRALVRADPDVIMVGEIRDLETAKMAADAAITGHLVFSTLHTNDAAAAVNRLVEMGVPRYLVAAAWRCVVAQRLVRRLCVHCRKEESLGADRWEELGLGPAPRKRIKVYQPVGCAKCFGTGYRGRVGVYEVMAIDDDLRDLIATGGSTLEIQRMARAKGVPSLREDALGKVLDGTTSYLELLRVTV